MKAPTNCPVCGGGSFAFVEADTWDCDKCHARLLLVAEAIFLGQRFQLTPEGVADLWDSPAKEPA